MKEKDEIKQKTLLPNFPQCASAHRDYLFSNKLPNNSIFKMPLVLQL